MLGWLPRAGVAGLLLIGGYAVATIASAAVGRAATRATARRQPVVEATTRIAVNGAAAVLALSQLGIDTTILNILVAAAAFGVALALAGIAVLGGREVARSIAAGRSVSHLLTPGSRITFTGYTGTIREVSATHVVLVCDDGATAVLPLSAADHAPLIVHTSDPAGND